MNRQPQESRTSMVAFAAGRGSIEVLGAVYGEGFRRGVTRTGKQGSLADAFCGPTRGKKFDGSRFTPGLAFSRQIVGHRRKGGGFGTAGREKRWRSEPVDMVDDRETEQQAIAEKRSDPSADQTLETMPNNRHGIFWRNSSLRFR